ncbi:hypothetical protein MKX01_023064 [Papaver californicum]|nr:hypothetical protein MKX01_023064 [Papaver californicum]
MLLFVFLLSIHSTLASDPDPSQDFGILETKQGSISSSQPKYFSCKNSSEAMVNDFIFSGVKHAGNFSATGISATSVNPTNFPGLNTLGMSFVRADLDVRGINAPHFHPRATEVALVLEGTIYSGFVDTSNRIFTKVINKGEVMVFPKGLVHFQMNVGNSPAIIFGSFNSPNPGLMRISTAIFGSGINEELLEKSFGLTVREIERLKRRFFPKHVV